MRDRFKSYDNFNDAFVHDLLGFFWIWIQSAVDDGGVSRRMSVAVGVSDRWKVTCYTLHVICDM